MLFWLTLECQNINILLLRPFSVCGIKFMYAAYTQRKSTTTTWNWLQLQNYCIADWQSVMLRNSERQAERKNELKQQLRVHDSDICVPEIYCRIKDNFFSFHSRSVDKFYSQMPFLCIEINEWSLKSWGHKPDMSTYWVLAAVTHYTLQWWFRK